MSQEVRLGVECRSAGEAVGRGRILQVAPAGGDAGGETAAMYEITSAKFIILSSGNLDCLVISQRG